MYMHQSVSFSFREIVGVHTLKKASQADLNRIISQSLTFHIYVCYGTYVFLVLVHTNQFGYTLHSLYVLKKIYLHETRVEKEAHKDTSWLYV